MIDNGSCDWIWAFFGLLAVLVVMGIIVCI